MRIEKLAVDQLSRLSNDSQMRVKENIREEFPNEHLLLMTYYVTF